MLTRNRKDRAENNIVYCYTPNAYKVHFVFEGLNKAVMNLEDVSNIWEYQLFTGGCDGPP